MSRCIKLCPAWIWTAVATVARLLAEGKEVKLGVHFLMDAVDPIAFMVQLREGEVERIDNVERLG
jgi:hypothetical protein